MADAIVSVVLKQLVEVTDRQIQHKLLKGVDEEVMKLTSNFLNIRAVLADAGTRQVKEAAVGVWLEKLKYVSYDTEDVLDQWNTAIMKRLQTEGAENARSIKRKVCSCFLFPYSCLKQVVLSHNIASKLKAINGNLDAIAKEKDGYNLKITTTPTSVELPLRIASTPFVDVSMVVGLDVQNNALVAKLLDQSCEEGNGLHVISVVGMGGIGKTTLAQLAYNNCDVINHFEKRIWVCVSNPFDKLRTAKAILETLEDHASDLSMLQSLLQRISESLWGKKFLIVLDDVWTKNYRDWEPFHHCLKNGLRGSKVLVTTRKQTTALMMNSIDIISIEELSIEHCWSLFRQLAFFGRSDEECEKLEGIGREIVSKCKGLPLAVKTMGSLLRYKKTREEWENILYSDDMFKEESTPFVDVSEVVESPHQREESTPFVDVSMVVGLDVQNNALVAKLLDQSCEEGNGLHVISMVGMGGIGKTTLAQLAYNNCDVINHFEKRIWVCVSDPFDKLRTAKAILETLEDHASDLSMLQSLLQRISESLWGKKFLIVLDDVWTKNYRDWEPFHHCLKNGLRGSKVLVTTRKQTTALMMNSIDIISIEELSIEHCWSLFRQLAFFGRSDEECEKLEGIGREIVSKCKGLPLAVKTMGSLLRYKKTREEWENILYSDDMFKEESTPFVDVSEVVESPHQREESTPFVDVSMVVGLDVQNNALVAKLLDQSCEEGNGLHVISMVGMGGIGKTTLAQLAYNNCDVINHFEKRIWVCVSDPFDKLRTAKAILETLEDHASDLFELEYLLQRISESLWGKKFLIVLDDMWTEDCRDWEPFHYCLKNGLHGSKVLVTTRKQSTAFIMMSIETISIEGLSEEHCWSLFRQFAFFGRSDEECKELEGIGREIVSKCNSLPLAVKTMGSLLRFKRTKEEWKNILDSEMWELRESENIIFRPLLLSYYDLLPMVKRCFTYCAMFPKDFLFQKDELIKLWMAQGYLELEHNEGLEIIGEEYFNSLAMRSFFQEFIKDDDGRIIRCKMPNIVHEVAQHLSKNECRIIEAKNLREDSINALCETAHQLRVMAERRVSRDILPISICNFKKLRILLTDGDLYASNKVLRKIFDELTCLKALGIGGSGTSFKRIPKEIGKLIHLRYLDLSNNEKLRKLPETVCELWNLQTLKLGGCSNLKELPQGIGELINLRHLMNLDTDSLRYMPKGMERLIHLRTLNEFHLNGGDYGDKACSLEYFLNNFRQIESLWIKGLAKGIEESIAQLKNNENIRALGLGFSGSFIRSDSTYKDDEAILEAFQPPPNLQLLTIKYYFGHTMSTLRKMTSLTNLRLRSITLSDCRKCLHMPPLGKLPYLETLVIEWLTNVREVGNELLGAESGEASSSSSSIIYFPKLKTLRFGDMHHWEVWDFGNEDDTCTIMPSLRSLQIHHCYKLKGLPKQFLQMEKLQLEIYNCYILARLYSKRKGDNPNIQIGWR